MGFFLLKFSATLVDQHVLWGTNWLWRKPKLTPLEARRLSGGTSCVYALQRSWVSSTCFFFSGEGWRVREDPLYSCEYRSDDFRHTYGRGCETRCQCEQARGGLLPPRSGVCSSGTLQKSGVVQYAATAAKQFCSVMPTC